MKAELTKHRQEDFLDDLVLRAHVQIGGKLFPPLQLRGRQRTVRVRLLRDGVGGDVAQLRYADHQKTPPSLHGTIRHSTLQAPCSCWDHSRVPRSCRARDG